MCKSLKNSILIVVVFLFISSCKKSPDSMGLKTLPVEDLLGAEYVDTLTLITHTVKDDSLPVAYKGVFIFPALLGTMNDPVCGLSSASLYTQLSLSSINPLWGRHPVLDSAVFSLGSDLVGYDDSHDCGVVAATAHAVARAAVLDPG